MSYSPIIEIKYGNRTLSFLLDTGASVSFINANILKNEETQKTKIQIETVGGLIYASKVVKVPIFNPFNKTMFSFIVSPNKLPFDGILGIDIMNELNAHISLQESSFRIKRKCYEIKKLNYNSCNNIILSHQIVI